MTTQKSVIWKDIHFMPDKIGKKYHIHVERNVLNQDSKYMQNSIITANLVYKSDNQVFTTSLLVAAKFGKEHKNVIASIRTILNTAENSALLNWFMESSYTASNGKENPMYVMTRDGFSLLVMGFTGAEALKFQMEFIEAFNKMEAVIKQNQHFAIPQTFSEALMLAAKQQEQIELQSKQLEEQKPKVDYAELV